MPRALGDGGDAEGHTRTLRRARRFVAVQVLHCCSPHIPEKGRRLSTYKQFYMTVFFPDIEVNDRRDMLPIPFSRCPLSRPRTGTGINYYDSAPDNTPAISSSAQDRWPYEISIAENMACMPGKTVRRIGRKQVLMLQSDSFSPWIQSTTYRTHKTILQCRITELRARVSHIILIERCKLLNLF
jgi:hypothetical protein